MSKNTFKDANLQTEESPQTPSRLIPKKQHPTASCEIAEDYRFGTAQARVGTVSA